MGETGQKLPEPFPPTSRSLPYGWERRKLDDIAQRGSGHTPDQKKPEYWDGDIKWVSLADSSKLDAGVITDTDKRISVLGLRHSSAVLYPAGTVIVSRDAGVGKSAVLGSEMAVSQHFIAWDCSKHKKIEPWFLYSWLQNNKPFFERMAFGSTIKTIGMPLFARLTIEIPSLSEQRKIAEILRTWDEAIEALGALRTAKKKRMNSLVSRMVNGQEYERQRLRNFIRDVSERNSNGAVDRVLSVTNSAGFVPAENQFAHRVASADTSNYKIVRKGQYAYNPARINVGSIARLDDWDNGVLSPMYAVFELKAGLDSDFFSHWLSSYEAKQRIRRAAQGSVRETVGLDDLGAIMIPCPPPEKQAATARMLNAAQEDLRLTKQNLNALQRQKRGLMQKLLTGEWRVAG